MIQTRLAFASICLAAFALASGCASAADEELTLTSAESALVSDSEEASETDDTMEAGVEETTSGAEPADPASAPDPTVADGALETAIRTNPGKFFTPAGCIATTWDAGTKTATHVFTNCTGPLGLRSFNGTIVAKWTRGNGQLSVTRTATAFQIDGATVSGSVTVTWTKSGTTYTKTRKASFTGKNKNGKDLSRSVDLTTTYDTATRCVTRDGTAQTTLASRSFDTSITGYKRCGIGSLGCPQSGKISLTGTGPNGSGTLTIEFTGGRGIKITRPNGKVVSGEMKLCRAT